MPNDTPPNEYDVTVVLIDAPATKLKPYWSVCVGGYALSEHLSKDDANLDADAIRKAITAAKRRGLARAAEIAENEPELPGPIPEELRTYDTEHLCRSCVRTTKKNIADAIKAEMEKHNAE